MNSPTPQTLVLLIFIPLIGWRLYSRIRRIVGRQRLYKGRLWLTIGVYSVFLALILLAGLAHPERLGWLLGGLVIGSSLGVLGLRLTRFEPSKEGLFYTPHAHLGIAISLLFVARISYRFYEMYSAGPTARHDDFTRSPLTLCIFGLLAGYYVTYAIGLLRWRNRILQAQGQREAPDIATDATPQGND